MIETTWRTTLEPLWTGAPSVSVGRGTPPFHHAERHLGVLSDGSPLFRIDLYGNGEPPECCAFEEALYWQGWIAIGYGEGVYLVSVESREFRRFPLDRYFGSFWPGEEFLLAASAERLHCLTPDGELRWRTEPLGLDGVLVHGVEAGVISGDGEWDPPGGWRPFTVDLASGAVLSSGQR